MNNGILYVVATPIGNLEDISDRAKRVLRQVDLIAAEDTRHTATLLRTIGCDTPMLSLHDHNEHARIAQLHSALTSGKSVALVSDAGTPLISDPGYSLLHELSERGINVRPVPGPCAAIAALSAAGLPTDRFVFEGFLPPKPTKRKAQLRTLQQESRTLVFYESPHRIAETLGDLVETFGADRRAVICRELTKLHETHYHGALETLLTQCKQDADMQRGELVIVVAGAELAAGSALTQSAQTVMEILLTDLPPAHAAKLAAKLCNADRRALYQWATGSRDP